MRSIIFIILFVIPLNSQIRWEKVNGPVGGSVSSLRNFGDTLIAGLGDKGIIFFSTDNGESWRSVYKTNQRIVDFEKTIDGGLLVSISSNGIYKTFDLTNWVRVYYNASFMLKIGKSFDNELYAGNADGKIFYSSNNGISWNSSFNTTGNINDFVLLPDSNLLVEGASKIIRKKRNSQWETIIFPDSIGSNYHVHLTYGNDTIYSSASSRSFMSTDGGNTWIYKGLLWGESLYDILFNTRLIGAFGDETSRFGDRWGISVSSDQGASWQMSNFGLPPKYAASLRLVKHGSKTYLGTYSAGVFKSTDFGDSWFPINNGLTAADVFDICFDNEETIYSASWSNGFQKSTDKGNSWTVINNGLTNVYCYSIIVDNNGNLIGGTDQGIFRSTDGGLNWIQTASAGNNFPYRLHKDNQNRIYSLNFDGGIYRTDNLGAGWARLDNGFVSTGVFGFAVDSSNNLYAGTRGGWIYKSTNDGNSWFVSRQGTGSFYGIVMIRVAPNGYIFASTNDQGMIRSTDNGLTWENVSNTIPWVNSRCLEINKRGEIITSFADSYYSNALEKIYYSSNNGETWEDYNSNLYLIQTRKILFDENNYVYLATDESVWRSTAPTPVELISFTAEVSQNTVKLNWETATETNNRGFEVERKTNNDWITIAFIEGKGTTTDKQAYSFTDKNLGQGRYKYRLKQIDFDGTFEFSDEVEADISIPKEFALNQNYPNPFNPSTTISFSLPKDEYVTLKIYNTLGEEINTLVNSQLDAGEHKINFDASNVSSGIYFYKITAGEYTAVKKMQVMK